MSAIPLPVNPYTPKRLPCSVPCPGCATPLAVAVDAVSYGPPSEVSVECGRCGSVHTWRVEAEVTCYLGDYLAQESPAIPVKEGEYISLQPDAITGAPVPSDAAATPVYYHAGSASVIEEVPHG